MGTLIVITGMLSKSRFNRRVHSIFEFIIDLFLNIADIIKRLNISSEYTIDILIDSLWQPMKTFVSVDPKLLRVINTGAIRLL